MIHDLEKEASASGIEPPVCVIGAGTAGLALAQALAERGVDVALIEAGPAIAAVREATPELVFDRAEYRGATLGRAFGFGGTSTIWGGQLLPIAKDDLGPREGVPAWPLGYEDFSRHFQEVESWLGVDAGSFDLGEAMPDHPVAQLQCAPFFPRLSKWIGFGRRNFARLMEERCRQPGVDVWINAQAVEWEVAAEEAGFRIAGVIAASPSGHRLRVRPKRVVIAAGALESARLLADLQAQTGCLASETSQSIGRFLHDHLSLRLARVRVRDRRRFGELFAPLFSGNTMRTLKLELSGAAAWSRDLPSLYLHCVAEAPEGSGFAVVRDVFRGFQRGDFRSSARALLGLPRAVPGLVELAFWRYFRKRLVFPAGAPVFLHADFEQPARWENRVYSAATEDSAGRGEFHVDWSLAGEPESVAARLAPWVRDFWSANGLDEVAELEFLPEEAGIHNLYDIFHPAGTTRMAAAPNAGVVDPNLKIHGIDNTYVLSTSVFPSLGSANPTFTLLALAIRLANRLAETFQRVH